MTISGLMNQTFDAEGRAGFRHDGAALVAIREGASVLVTADDTGVRDVGISSDGEVKIRLYAEDGSLLFEGARVPRPYTSARLVEVIAPRIGTRLERVEVNPRSRPVMPRGPATTRAIEALGPARSVEVRAARTQEIAREHEADRAEKARVDRTIERHKAREADRREALSAPRRPRVAGILRTSDLNAD